MIRWLMSTLFLFLVGFAMAQPIEDYTVVCTTTVETTEVDTDGNEVVTSETTETTIGVASYIDGEWHVSLDRELGTTCEGDVTLVPQFETEDDDTAPTIQIDAPDEETPEDTDGTTDGDGEPTDEPVEEGEGEEGEGEDGTAVVVTIDEETAVENVVSVPAVAIAGKERAQRNRNEAWQRRDERRGGPEEEPSEPEEEEPEDEPEDEPEEEPEDEPEDEPESEEPEAEEAEEGEQDASGRPDNAGPPDHAGPPDGDDDVEAEEDEDEDDDERGGPPADRGGPPSDRGNGKGRP